MTISDNKQKAIAEFSALIAKDCAGLIERVIEKRMSLYLTHLAEIMEENHEQNPKANVTTK